MIFVPSIERKGDFELAVQYLQASLSGRREHLDELDSEIAVTLARLGRVYSKKSEFSLFLKNNANKMKIRWIIRLTLCHVHIPVI